MTVASVGSATPPPPPAPAVTSPSTTGRAADGDYLSPNVNSVSTKDNNGDYKPVATQATTSAVASSSSSTQAALSSIKLGG